MANNNSYRSRSRSDGVSVSELQIEMKHFPVSFRTLKVCSENVHGEMQ